ncbi:MAG: hypothetical protein JWN73_4249 [Betaproteobacteria bacterium]|nr:hypothetical protein [Betaproteobacteria bacterium]
MQVWDIFCRVVDNYGDAGVTWRLARQLAAEYGLAPRLWIDEPAALAHMGVGLDVALAVQMVEKVELRQWREGAVTAEDAIADVVIEAFACELPQAYVQGMARRVARPVWINLEYLSAEDWVEGTHKLASPQNVPAAIASAGAGAGGVDDADAEAGGVDDAEAGAGARVGAAGAAASEQAGADADRREKASAAAVASTRPPPLNKYFFFPGFTAATGGLLRERGLLQVRAKFQADAAAQAVLWRALDVPPREEAPSGELRISLFAYENLALPELLAAWAEGDVAVRCLVPVGRALPQVAAFFGAGDAKAVQAGAQWSRGQLAVHVLPFTDQPGYDRLLWACDLNFVRGEDSFVRAQWAARPFVWQIYPQAEAAHHEKLTAFWRRYRAALPEGAATAMQAAWHGWNGIAAADWPRNWSALTRERAALQSHADGWASRAAMQPDLAAQLVEFAAKVPKFAL